MRYLGGENIHPLPRKLIDAIAQRLRVEGLTPDPQDIDRLFTQARSAYEWSRDVASTDAIPAIAGVQNAAVELVDHVHRIAQTLNENAYLTGCLDAFMRNHNMNDSTRPFGDHIHKLTWVAVAFERYIGDAIQRGRPRRGARSRART